MAMLRDLPAPVLAFYLIAGLHFFISAVLIPLSWVESSVFQFIDLMEAGAGLPVRHTCDLQTACWPAEELPWISLWGFPGGDDWGKQKFQEKGQTFQAPLQQNFVMTSISLGPPSSS